VACGQWFSPCTPVSSTNINDHHDITEISLKVVLNNIILTLQNILSIYLSIKIYIAFLFLYLDIAVELLQEAAPRKLGKVDQYIAAATVR
jgi:hypothetical protein